MTTYTKEELQYLKRSLYQNLQKYYEYYLTYLKKYYESNLKLTLNRKL